MTKTFTAFKLQPFIQTALETIGFKHPTPIQERLIPVIQEGKSVVGQSQTGSGKTHTFLVPLLNKLQPELNEVQIVITAPSRELAAQIYHAAQQLIESSPEPIRIGYFVGGTDKKRQLEKLRNQQPQIVIGTPGRILDMSKENALKIYTANALVIDEADMTLDMGFLHDVDQIAGNMPEKLQILVFSATIPEKLKPFLKKYLNNPVMEKIQAQAQIADGIENILLSTKGQAKNQLIYQLLTMGNPYLAIVFANTKQRADEIADYLKGQHLKIAKIHGDVPPRERKRTMKQIQNLDYQYIVATDLAARGIDIAGVSLIINDDLPRESEFFIHRVGRTGRNQLQGTAITLYEPGNEKQVVELEKRGVSFIPKEFKNGELIASYDRNRRTKRAPSQAELDPTMLGLVKKTSKKVKPGYRKKLTKAIAEDRRQKRKTELRSADRAKRKARKKNSSW